MPTFNYMHIANEINLIGMITPPFRSENPFSVRSTSFSFCMLCLLCVLLPSTRNIRALVFCNNFTLFYLTNRNVTLDYTCFYKICPTLSLLFTRSCVTLCCIKMDFSICLWKHNVIKVKCHGSDDTLVSSI